MKQIPWANPWFDKNEKEEILATFDSTWLSMGPRTKALEEKMRQYAGVKHAIAVSNGTVALDLALKALGIGPGDEVIVPAMTYIATVSSVLYQYARLVFADIELDSCNIDPESVKKAITNETKCIIYIDYGGNPADHDNLIEISKKTKIPILLDGAQSLGTKYKGKNVYKLFEISTTSFHTAKLITTIEGGMIFCEDEAIAKKLRMMRNQGEDPEKKYIHNILGTNARLTDLQAAIGLKQLAKIEEILKRRAEIAEAYSKGFSQERKIRFTKVRIDCRNSWFFYPIFVENRDLIAEELKAVGIDTRIAYPLPVYEQPLVKKYLNNTNPNCPNAKWMSQRVLNLPIFHTMTKEEQGYVIENVLKIARKHG